MKVSLYILLVGSVLLVACNKEKRVMKGLLGNWKIYESEKAYLHADGSEEVYETLGNAGKLVVYEDSENPSKTSKLFDFMFIDQQGDTLQKTSTLVTDEKNKRIILTDMFNDSDTLGDLVFTVEKESKNKQTWAAYGVDSTYFYPANNHNPGAAENWVVWRITLKRE